MLLFQGVDHSEATAENASKVKAQQLEIALRSSVGGGGGTDAQQMLEENDINNNNNTNNNNTASIDSVFGEEEDWQVMLPSYDEAEVEKLPRYVPRLGVMLSFIYYPLPRLSFSIIFFKY